jgi:hypothetical protein
LNRYPYVGNDPSNYIDRTGLLRENCSDDWATDASASGPCSSDEARNDPRGGNGGGLACTSPGMALSPISIPSIPTSFCVAFVPPPITPEATRRVATYLLLIEDCYQSTMFGWERARTYQVLDQNHHAMGGGGFVFETWTPDLEPSGIVTNGIWPMTGFVDHLAFPARGGDPTTGNQEFVGVTYGVGRIIEARTLIVLEPVLSNGIITLAEYGVLGVYFLRNAPGGVAVNGSFYNVALNLNMRTTYPICPTPR